MDVISIGLQRAAPLAAMCTLGCGFLRHDLVLPCSSSTTGAAGYVNFTSNLGASGSLPGTAVRVAVPLSSEYKSMQVRHGMGTAFPSLTKAKSARTVHAA